MNPSKTDAKKDQFAGSVRENVGSALGNESMEARGKGQNASGNVQETLATAQNYVQGTVNQVTGAAKGAYNALIGDTSGEASAKVQNKKGEAQKEYNS